MENDIYPKVHVIVLNWNNKELTEEQSNLTREIYHKQHKRIVEDDKSMKRFIKMFSNQYFGLERKFFKTVMPVFPDFSGWNCVAHKLFTAIAALRSSP